MPMTLVPELRLDRLRAFAAVAREGGFSRAARALGRTQSSVSQAVALLEDDVGDLLIVRDGRRTALTEAGRVLRDHAERVLAALADARAAVAALRDVAGGRLVVGTSDTFATHLLPPVLAGFRARHPAVELHLDNRPSPVIAAAVATRAVDVGVVALPLPPGLRLDGRAVADALRIAAIAPLRDVAIVPPDHPLARRRRVTPAVLAGHPLVVLDRTTAARAHLDAAFAAAGRAAQVAMEMNSVEVIKRLVALGFGASVVPEPAVRAEVAAGALVAIPLVGAPARQLGVITPAAGATSRAARVFAGMIAELLAPDPGAATTPRRARG
ncbi:MAG: LysR family transcriptional regulator [Kofleriaceae bacterium]|nr:LysR family transcriptional regulator [Kofleriaceae bacterium]MCB9573993.1 LysR family transcriptional regulator [Kofleriaceae bacterium]